MRRMRGLRVGDMEDDGKNQNRRTWCEMRGSEDIRERE